MKPILSIFGKRLLTLLTWIVLVPAGAQPVINTTSGQVSGTMQEGTMAYLGIPYAKVERCMPPQPVTPWIGVRACDKYGPQAMQPTGGRQLPEDEMSEQCCVLNVWTTDLGLQTSDGGLQTKDGGLQTTDGRLQTKDGGLQTTDGRLQTSDKKQTSNLKSQTSNLKPVMVWLHGGGFDSGTSQWNPGYNLAKKDVVVVGVNHRLNILGFLDLSAVSPKYKYSGNVGMLDVVQALEWVRDNIALFGGDPNNVTIFGESGGGGKVGTLMCMPKAKGLFHKAIIMSGTILNVNNWKMTQELGRAVLKELGISEQEADRIKDVPYQLLYEAGQRAMAASIGTRRPGTPMMWGFGPTPDGETLLQQPFQPGFASISKGLPLMMGTTFNELQRLRYDQQLTIDEARTELRKTFGDDTEAYIKAFAKAWPDYTPQDLLSIDWLFRPKTLITADAVTAQPSPLTPRLYLYMYTCRSPKSKGSVHGAELNYCFNTLSMSQRDLGLVIPGEDQRLADVMSSVWAQFAHTGNPNIEGLPAWKPYTAKNGEMMVFDHDCYIRNNPDRDLQQLIDRHCFRQLDEFRKKQNSNK